MIAKELIDLCEWVSKAKSKPQTQQPPPSPYPVDGRDNEELRWTSIMDMKSYSKKSATVGCFVYFCKEKDWKVESVPKPGMPFGSIGFFMVPNQQLPSGKQVLEVFLDLGGKRTHLRYIGYTQQDVMENVKNWLESDFYDATGRTLIYSSDSGVRHLIKALGL